LANERRGRERDAEPQPQLGRIVSEPKRRMNRENTKIENIPKI